MNVTITDVDQRYSLRSQSFSNLLTVELPSGLRFQVQVDDEVVQAVLKESNGQPSTTISSQRIEKAVSPQGRLETNGQSHLLESNPFELGDSLLAEKLDEVAAEAQEPRETPVDWPERQLEHHVESGAVEWETLPDGQLPPSVKNIMRASGIKPVLTIEELNQLKVQILEKLASRPKTGQVDWNSGPRRNIQAVQQRRINMDEAGNPLPPGGIIEMREEKDPGEVRDEDGDEGVQQA